MVMETYYELEGDIFDEYVPEIAQQLQDNITFRGGAIIQQPLPSPLIFTTRHSAQKPPKGMHSLVIPVMSNSFIAALQGAGISNLQCFPAELRSTVDGSVWKDYNAVNIIGLISCADLSASEFTHIIDRPEEDASPLLAFEDLKIDPARTRDALLFRLAESPGVILVAGSVVEYLRAQRSDDDWGITLDER
jgi:hypothetical protein